MLSEKNWPLKSSLTFPNFSNSKLFIMLFPAALGIDTGKPDPDEVEGYLEFWNQREANTHLESDGG